MLQSEFLHSFSLTGPPTDIVSVIAYSCKHTRATPAHSDSRVTTQHAVGAHKLALESLTTQHAVGAQKPGLKNHNFFI